MAEVELEIQHEVVAKSRSLAESLRVAARAYGRRPFDLVREVAGVSFGAGKVTPAEYFEMRLFDTEHVSRDGLSAFAGRRAAVRANFVCNHDLHWMGISGDKLLFHPLALGLGLPVPELQAVYVSGRTMGHVPVFESTQDLRGFLSDPSSYPLFCKPNTTRQSVGTASLDRYDPASDEVVDLFGRRTKLETFLSEIERYREDGMLFDRRVAPHPELEALAGPALSTVRVLVMETGGVRRIARAHLKLPARGNVADNSWRAGNMAVAIDAETGVLQRALAGNGIDAVELTEHPDTHTPLAGFRLPFWTELRDLALRASRCLPGLRIQGWDIAIGVDGPLLVEVNGDPDWAVTQMLTGRGLYDEELRAMVERLRPVAHKAFKERLLGA